MFLWRGCALHRRRQLLLLLFIEPAMVEGIAYDFDPTPYAEFLKGAGFIGFNRLYTQIELKGDLFVAIALGDQAQNNSFTLTQEWGEGWCE